MISLKDEGIPFEINGEVKQTLTVVPADNLASQAIGGFIALNSAFRKCRQCLAVNEDMQTKVYCLDAIT